MSSGHTAAGPKPFFSVIPYSARMTSLDAGFALLVAFGGVLVVVALASLPSESPIRLAYRIDPSDDAGARSNAAVLGATGAFVLALAAADAGGVAPRLIAGSALGTAAAGTAALGWLVRYRDRRELLTTPDVSRERGRRLGGALVVTGALFCLPLAAVLIEPGTDALVLSVVGTSTVSVLLIAAAYR